ncbi:hypothetical protein DB30_04499 [Enhygromyxa salina]|uniref:Uncharacterized protein n=2 Tax=Enhygromyxa salina TaxID=215803 RepID=A0A0C2D414_9BACT|nr:hypothetical protein DB30_04499 [Enhygromyxa salina]
MGVVIGATMAAAPSVEATCDHVLELASLAGESVGGSDHAACIHYYADQRAGRGALGWTWLSWCTWAAQSIPEAGEC